MKSKALLTALALSTGAAIGAEPQPIPLWPAGAPGQKAVTSEEKNQTPKDDIIRLTNVTNPTITLYPAAQGKQPAPAVMVCPGGGYGILAYDLEGTEICQWLNSLGINAVLLKYRVPDGRDHPLQDAQRAMGMVRLHAAEWHIDPKKLGVIGFSAGGHLSASLSTHFASRTYPPVDKADELSCRPDFAMLIYPAYLVQDKDLEKLATDITVSADTPQTFLVQTENDFAHSECSLFYYLALKKAKVAAELHLYPGDTHGYGLRPARDPVASTWTKRAEEWMRHQKILPAEPAPLASP